MIIWLCHCRLKNKSHVPGIYIYALYLFFYSCFTDDINYKQKKECHYVYWVSDCCLTPIVHLYRDDWVHFVLDQHHLLDCNSASSLKQQSADRLVVPLGHIILIPSQPVFALSFHCYMLSWEAANTNVIV
jgi:hypothetical protein